MPRQQISYMVPEPLEPLNLEEIRFWLRIMQEHALFIKSGLPCDSSDLIDEAQAFYQELESLRLRADRVQSDRKFNELVSDAQAVVKEFYIFKRTLLHMMLECKLGGCNFPLLLDHTAREAEYFMRLLDKLKNAKTPVTGGSKAQENSFWLRIMADHAKFISHLLDPSEYNLIATANAFSEEFDNLFMQGRDFSSMLHGYSEVPAFRRFLQDVRAATVRLRDFKRAAEEMIAECRLVGIIPALLADHVRREADHFLLLMAMMEKGVMKNMPLVAFEDMEEVLVTQDIQESKSKVIKVMKPEREQEQLPVEVEPEPEIDCVVADKNTSPNKIGAVPKYSSYESKKAVIEEPVAAIEEQVVIEKPAPVTEVQTSDAKYKWSGKWPRQLGKKDE